MADYPGKEIRGVCMFTDVELSTIRLCCKEFEFQRGYRMEFHDGTVVGKAFGGAVSLHFTGNGVVKEYMYIDRQTLEVTNDYQQKIGVGYVLMKDPIRETLNEGEQVAMVFAENVLRQNGFRATADQIKKLREKLV